MPRRSSTECSHTHLSQRGPGDGIAELCWTFEVADDFLPSPVLLTGVSLFRVAPEAKVNGLCRPAVTLWSHDWKALRATKSIDKLTQDADGCGFRPRRVTLLSDSQH